MVPGGRAIIVARTERLVLRRFHADDLSPLTALNADPEVMRYITSQATPPTEVRDRLLPEYLADYERLDGLGRFAAEERATGAFIGWFSLRPVEGAVGTLELGYRLLRDSWGQGYATEGGQAILELAFATFGADRVVAQTMTVNTRSRAVMERLGMHLLRSFSADWGEDIPGGELGDVEYIIEPPQWGASTAVPWLVSAAPPCCRAR